MPRLSLTNEELADLAEMCRSRMMGVADDQRLAEGGVEAEYEWATDEDAAAYRQSWQEQLDRCQAETEALEATIAKLDAARTARPLRRRW